MSLTLHPTQIVESSSSPLLASHANWPRVRLGSVSSILNGDAFKSRFFSSESGMPLIRIRDITSDQTATRYAGEYDERYVIQAGELLVGMDGEFNVARWRGERALLNQRVCRVTPVPESLDLGFLTHILPGYLQAIHDVTSSTTVKHLSSRDIAEIPIPLPTLTEQRRIAGRLDDIEMARATVVAHLASTRPLVQRFRTAVVAAACSGRLTADWREDDPDPAWDVPPSWRRATLGELTDSIRGGSSEVPTAGITDFPVLRSSSVRPLCVDYDDVRYLSTEQSQKAANFVADGDLLITRLYGNIEYVGNASVVDGLGERRLQYPDRLFRLRLTEPARAPYVQLFFASPRARAQVQAASRSAAGHQRISISDLKGFVIEVPPIDEQHAIVLRANTMLTTATRITTQIEGAAATLGDVARASLSTAFRGELVPTEAALAEHDGRAFESADEQLTRVGAARLKSSSRRRDRL